MKIGFLSLVGFLLYAQADSESLSDAARTAATQRRFEEAADLWTKALAINPKHFASLFNFGYMRYSLAQYAEAASLFRRAARIQPEDFNIRYILGSTLVQLGQREDALREWKSALALQPANVKLMQVMAIEYGTGRYFQESCALAKRALAIKIDDESLAVVAIKACQDAQDGGAIELTGKAAARFPESARLNFEHGFQLKKSGRVGESIRYLQKSIDADPGYEEPHFVYGEILLAQDKYAEAAVHLRKALEIRPDYVAACVSLAKSLLGAQRDQEALTVLNQCVQQNPQHPQPHLLLSQIYFRLGDEQKAQAEKDKSLELRRSNPSVTEGPQSRPFPAEPKSGN